MTIKVLPSETALKIAAGEVIERPASVVKELIENSIDAGSHSIRVEIRNGGLTYIRISDDGCGISFAEVPIAFERHATSKINEAEDLYKLHTLGFRGEALPSIASVSQMTLLTRPRNAGDEETGSEISFEGGKFIYHKVAGAPPGTVITVRNLFFNLPARQKWSRSGTSEAGHILNIVSSYALAYPEIKFALVSENRLLLQTSGNGDLRDAISKVYGPEMAQAMLPVTPSATTRPVIDEDGVIVDEIAEPSKDKVQVSGYVGDPSFNKPNRNYITFFVNRRLVQSKMLTYALQDAYQSLLMSGRFPVAVLLLEVDPAEVDANVHPAKTEVRFLHERSVFSAVQKAARAALVAGSSIPVWSAANEDFDKFVASPSNSQINLTHNIYAPPTPTQENRGEQGSFDFVAPASRPTDVPTLLNQGEDDTEIDLMDEMPITIKPTVATIKAETNNAPELEPAVAPEPEVAITPKLPLLRVLGQMANTYIVAEGPDGMYLIDQHAAHERVMYERFQSQLYNRALDSQLLLEPALLQLIPRQRLALQDAERLHELEAFGFQLEPVAGADTLLLKAVPATLFGRPVTNSLNEMLDEADGVFVSECAGSSGIGGDILNEPDETAPRSWRDRMAASLACHTAVRAGQILNQQEMRELIAQLEVCANPHNCAHGRPTMVHLSQGQLEKRFGRK